ncbi:MAG TPA: Maf and M48 domain-containing protein [Candidatus Omnitrophota bacterium]|nr:septum formation protein Maf [Candidatus Omnitrophota bacterium]HNQ50566.1 Maf and M48 domain-containing protein [Candidatus Omnitrophota bacterium]HQO37511.1 Maf and M48 domain-containing protein [Candidatus Omnitrophota bacterium]HQQ06446.1 Maf and M48 domain-containing protein [Candidatus Omnitrophota bacterium]
MQKIYLASDSKARRKLLEIFGLKFTVISSGAAEQMSPRQRSFADLVKHNAEAKARAAGRRVKDGIIIAADTIVVDGKRIYGKPRDLADAHRMLKKLSGRSQWIYSGVAVYDKGRARMRVSYEKTRIHMDALTDKEIDAYFSYVSPLDKAGSFDIQGKGAFFIRRIEGCFYNVVGLPLRTLYRMLKAAGVSVFAATLFVLSGLACGCSHEFNVATGRQEAYYYSTEQELAMGRSVAKQVEKEYDLVDDPLVQQRVSGIGRKIAAVSDRRDIEYRFKALAEDEINAVSLPGGYVYVFKGLLDITANDDELAAVLAHEVGHIVARHSIKKMQATMGYTLARLLMIPVPQSGAVATAADAAFIEFMLGYSREDELLADTLGARYARAAGYDPGAMITFLQKLEDHNRRKPLRPRSYYKTHPYVPDRIRVVKQEIGAPISFTDFINTEQDKNAL